MQAVSKRMYKDMRKCNEAETSEPVCVGGGGGGGMFVHIRVQSVCVCMDTCITFHFVCVFVCVWLRRCPTRGF